MTGIVTAGLVASACGATVSLIGLQPFCESTYSAGASTGSGICMAGFHGRTIREIDADIGCTRPIHETMETNMQPSREFKIFTSLFIQDLETFGSNDEEIFQFILGGFRGDDRTRLRAFLNDIVQETVSDQELDRLWRLVNDEIYFPEGGYLRAMLKDARDRL